MTTTSKPSTLFWIIAVAGLLWNLMGLYQFYLGTAGIETLKEAVSPAEFEIMQSTPSWYLIAFAIAVFAGFIAAVLLLARKKLAVPLFLLSLIAVVITEAYWLLGTEILEVSGAGAAVMPIIVILAGLFYYLYSKNAAAKGWLH